VAKGGKDTHYALQRAFCGSVLGVDVQPADPVRPVYDLSILLDPTFTFPTDPRDGIFRVSLTKILLLTKGADPEVDFLKLGFSKSAGRQRAVERIHRNLEANDISAGGVYVKDAALVFRFLECRGSRSNEMTLNITAPNGCDLKDKTEEMQVIAERCLKMWEIRRA
jgi:hypothetical protein